MPRVGDVVDRHELDVGLALVRRTEQVPPDATEAVDADLYGHAFLLQIVVPWSPRVGVPVDPRIYQRGYGLGFGASVTCG